MAAAYFGFILFILNNNTDIPSDGAPFTMISTVDSGHCIRQIFKQGKKYFGKTFLLAGHKATLEQYAEIMTDNIEGMTFKVGEVWCNINRQTG